jgi:F-type H+-transporting ATPase subunit b
MPQLDSSTFPSQIFWLFVSFALLFVACSSWIAPKIERIQFLRSQKIDKTLEKARLCQERVDILLKEYDNMIAHAKESASHMIKHTKEKHYSQRMKTEWEIKDWLKKELQQVEQKLDAEQGDAKSEMEETVLQISKLILEKISKQEETISLENIIVEKIKHV